jgi:hypothetical protein
MPVVVLSHLLQGEKPEFTRAQIKSSHSEALVPSYKRRQTRCCSCGRRTRSRGQSCCIHKLLCAAADGCMRAGQREATARLCGAYDVNCRCCIMLSAPVIRRERRIVVVSKHQLQRPSNDPQAGNNAHDLNAVVVCATRHRIVVPAVT